MKVITTIVLLFISYSNALVTGPKKSGTKVIKKAPVKKVPAKKAPVKNAPVGDKKTIVVEDLPGVLPPVGFFDPLDLSGKASDNLIRQYREAELTHGRVSMIAALGFLTGEAVQGVTPLFGGPTGAGVVQFGQVPSVFWVSLAAAAFAIETYRVKVSVNDIVTCSEEEKGKIRADYVFGDLGFDPLGLKPTDPEEFKIKQSKELQNGRLAMIGAAGILAQELVNKQGVFENLVNQFGIEIPTLAF